MTATRPLSSVASDYPLGVAFQHGAQGGVTWVLLAGTGAGVPVVSAVTVPDAGDPRRVSLPFPLASPGPLEAVSGLIPGSQGPTFAVAHGRALTALVLGDTPRTVVFPRGEGAPARDLVTPSPTLAEGPRGVLSAVLRWPGPWGMHRVHTRDAYESPVYSPARRDAFAAPAVTILGEEALVVQEHRVGTYTTDTEVRSDIELATLPANPWSVEGLRVTRLTDAVSAGRHPRTPALAAVDPGAPARGVVVIWHDDPGLMAVHAVPSRADGWQVHEVMRVADDTGVAKSMAVAPVHGVCPTLVAWRTQDDGAGLAVHVRAVDVTAGRTGAVTRVPAGDPGPGPRVALAWAGERTYMAMGSAQGVRAWEVAQAADCGLALRAVVLPPTVTARGMRLVGMAGDGVRAVLAVTEAGPEAVASSVQWATLDGATGRVTATPEAMTTRFGVDAVALASDAAVVGGRGREGAWVQRADVAAHGDEPGEDLLFRGARGVDFALTASGRHRRVWLADLAGPEETPFGPPRSVVLYSAVEALEDGPRTEVRTGVVPEADVATVTLDAVAGGSLGDLWGVTLSDSREGTEGCLPGAWVSLRGALDDRRVTVQNPDPGAPWPSLRALGDPLQQRCGDRVLGVAWSGTTLAAVVTGTAMGTRLVTGNVVRGGMHTAALDPGADGRAPAAGVLRVGGGWLVVWVRATGSEGQLRYREFHDDGSPWGAGGVLATGVTVPAGALARRGLAVALGPHGTLSVVVATAQGPRETRAVCGR